MQLIRWSHLFMHKFEDNYEAQIILKTTRSLCGEPTAALVLLRNSVTTTRSHMVAWQACLRHHDEARP